MAKGGWNTWQWNRDYDVSNMPTKVAIISLGSNDHQGIRTKHELEKVRAQVHAQRVYWILPAIKPNIQTIVRDLAKVNGDTVLEIPSLQKDGVHPSWAGYKELGKQAR